LPLPLLSGVILSEAARAFASSAVEEPALSLSKGPAFALSLPLILFLPLP
jgi:hypothetical protein